MTPSPKEPTKEKKGTKRKAQDLAYVTSVKDTLTSGVELAEKCDVWESKKQKARFNFYVPSSLQDKACSYWPSILLNGCRLGLVGKSDAKEKGFKVFKGTTYGDSAVFAFGVNSEEHKSLASCLKIFLEKTCKRWQPSSNRKTSQWYPELSDGTKVFHATDWSSNPATLVDMTLGNSFDAPSRWAKFVYADDSSDETAWFQCNLGEDTMIHLRDEKGRCIDKTEEETGVVYPGKSGMKGDDFDTLDNLAHSSLLNSGDWEARIVLQVRGVKLNPVLFEEKLYIVPRFVLHARVVVLSRPPEIKGSVMSKEKADKMLAHVALAGFQAPQKPKKPAAPKKVKETASIVDEVATPNFEGECLDTSDSDTDSEDDTA